MIEGINQGEIAFRLVIAFILGGLVGLERESHNKSAGFRTHILVCLGSALIMLVSIYGFTGFATNRDPFRLAAQVVSGIGFLGAGTIMREGSNVSGLTTAASLWVVSGIGLAVGAGYYYSAAITTGLSFLTLISLAYVEKRYIHRQLYQSLILVIAEIPGQIGKVGNALGKLSVTIKTLEMESLGIDNTKLQLKMLIKLPMHTRLEDVMTELVAIEGVYSIQVDD